MAYAFRCRNCNMLEESGHAGEQDVPRGCRLCGAGHHFILNAAGVPESVEEPENWIVLADLSDKELAPILAYHKIEASDIGKHTPAVSSGSTRDPVNLTREVTESLGSEDLVS